MSILKMNQPADHADSSHNRATDLTALETAAASVKCQLLRAETELKRVGRSGDMQAMLGAAESVNVQRRALSRAETALANAVWEAGSAKRVEASVALSTAIESAVGRIDLALCAKLGIRGATIIFDENSGNFSVNLITERVKAAKSPSQGRTRGTNSDVILRRKGIIAPETRIGVVLKKLPSGANPEDRRFTARFANDAKHVIWDLDGQEDSISGLARKLAEKYEVKANGESENGFRIFGLASDRSTSLEDIRKQVDGRRLAR